MLIEIAVGVTMFIVPHGTEVELSIGSFTLWLVLLVILFTATLFITLGVRKHYRCPRCEEIPVKGAVMLWPAVCPTCGATLTNIE